VQVRCAIYWGTTTFVRINPVLAKSIVSAMSAHNHRFRSTVKAGCTLCDFSGDVARRLVRDIPPDAQADDLRMIRTSEGKERVEFSLEPAYRFDAEKRAGRWLVAAFSEE